jgi:pseudoazurin
MTLKQVVAAFTLALAAGTAHGKTIVMEMRNSGPTGSMVFVPDYAQAAPGDTLVVKSVDPGHNAVTIAGMIPGKAAPLAGKINETVTTILTQPGFYGIKCVPHVGLGMVALVKVGKAAPNAAEATAAAAPLPSLSRTKMISLLAKAR